MRDPLRFTDAASDASGDERELLLAARGSAPRAEQSQAIWSALEAEIGAGALPASVLGKAKLVTLGKWVAVLATGSALGFAALRGFRTEAKVQAPQVTEPVVSAPSPASVPEMSLPAVSPSSEPGASEGASVAPPATSTSRAAAVPSLSQLQEESRAVLSIRTALRSGKASDALKQLAALRARFPHGSLLQEREALSIEALAKSGSTEMAARRAKAFLKRYPQSPYAADIARYQDSSH